MYLLYQGVKLSLRSQVSTLSIEPGKFVVLIPFTKKDRSQIAEPGCSETSSNVSEQNLISNKFADSTYSDMMQELSSLHQEESNNINTNKPEYGASYTMPFGNINSDISETKRKRGVDCDNQEGRPYDFLWSVLRSKTKNALEGQNCEKFVEVLESVNCLSDPYSGKCMLLREANMRGTGGGLYKTNSNNSSCFCPVWLKKIMEAFAFLSIFSAYLQLRREEVTLTHLKDALDQLGKFGVPIGIEDIEHLSVLCPKVIV